MAWLIRFGLTLNAELAEARERIGSVINAIEEGAVTSTTKQRLEILEYRLDDLKISIAQEREIYEIHA